MERETRQMNSINVGFFVRYRVLRTRPTSTVKDLDWGSLPDTPHVEYGYGRVDAFRAILSIAHGDANNNDAIENSDLYFIIAYLYHDGPRPFPSVLLADCNCDGSVDISDISLLITHFYQGGSAPVKPCYVFEISGPPPPVE